MPSLTVTEKEHWKERIGKRIEKKIETLIAGDPSLMTRIQDQARQRALQSLGLAEMQAELDAVGAQQKELHEKEAHLQHQMLAHVRRVPIEEVSETYHGYPNSQVTTAIQKRQTVHEDEFLAQNDLGQEILRLRREKENLLDTVWLATSPQHIKDLWQKVVELLGDEQTPLQKEALTISASDSKC